MKGGWPRRLGPGDRQWAPRQRAPLYLRGPALAPGSHRVAGAHASAAHHLDCSVRGGALLVFTPRPSPALRERGPVYGDVAAHISRAVTAPGGGPQRDTIGCHIIYTPGIVGVLPGRHPRKQRRGPRPQDCTPRWSVSEKGPFWEHVPGACRCGGCVTGGEAVT